MPQWQTRVIRRRDINSRFAILLVILVAMLAAWILDLFGRDPVRLFGWLGPLAVWVVAVAFAQKVVVDPMAVTVYSMFRVVRVPRAAIARGKVEPDRLRMITADGRLVTIRVGATWLWEPRIGSLERSEDVASTATRINDAMREIDQRPAPARLRVRLRWGVAAVGTACVATVLLDAMQWGPFAIR